MTLSVAQRVADSISEIESLSPIRIIWHAGEPLSVGIRRFSEILSPFESLVRDGRVRHVVQTNATLIDETWCDFFRDNRFHVGVSIDGPEWATSRRVHRGGRPAFERIMDGIATLSRHSIPFTCIAVVSADALGRAEELYQFFVDLGCYSLGLNIEEAQGLHNGSIEATNDRVKHFWAALFSAWRRNPAIEVREFSNALAWMNSVAAHKNTIPTSRDIFPTVGFDGTVALLSPELLGANSQEYGDFVAGNVLDASLTEISQQAAASKMLQDVNRGIDMCRVECPYFSLCLGGQPSNKYYEKGRFDVTETQFCRNAFMLLSDAILDSIPHKPNQTKPN